MKKFILLFIIAICATIDLSANPGDTAWVTLYNQRKITAYGSIDTTATLPTGKRYRKIRLHYILGRYACPASEQYCGSWDYTTQLYVKPAGADTVEMARLITPYATDWLSKGKSNDYVIDVTDYAPDLNGTVGFMYNYEGYSWGFTITLKLEMIEGIPPMDALAVQNVYDGYFAYGSSTDLIENHLIAKPFQYNTPAAKALVKNTISGHGSDDAGCSEFCSKYYIQKVNNTAIDQKQLWRSDCGLNDVYPQTGTWLFERGNWCPGAVVRPIYHDITASTSAASTFSLDIDMEPYTGANQSNLGGYNVVSQLITYSAPNATRDVSIEDIVSPTDDPNYFRSNPICSNPKIKVRNTGSSAVTSIVFQYNLVGDQPQSYTWTGNLPFMKDTVIDMGSSVNVFGMNTSNDFEVKIASVNGIASDDNTSNNNYRSHFTDVKSYPAKFVVYMGTNAATSATNAGKNETHWKIINDQGTTVYSHTNANNSTTYRDTVTLSNGCYTFICDDDGCDGINWWYYQYYDTNPGTGILRFTSATNPAIYKNFSGDFGCQIVERFTVGYLLGTNELNKTENTVSIYPNPAADQLNLLFDVSHYETVNYTICDVTGKQVMQGQLNDVSSIAYPVNISGLGSGVYFVSLHFHDGGVVNKRFVIGR
ncbi:MAG: T9SS type A sorting domain-containing protein [Bacteroidetes bacterium]|nr:T9SS type A sorting domain-containing protein [Bacteroidota bacterium]